MHGVIRAVAILACLFALAAIVQAQPPVSPRNSYERILVVLPLIGSGTAADPIRPLLIPAPGSTTPNILNLPISTPVAGTGLTAPPVGSTPGGPSYPQNQILGYTWVPSDDGKFALTAPSATPPPPGQAPAHRHSGPPPPTPITTAPRRPTRSPPPTVIG